jgi:hypothetical protein
MNRHASNWVSAPFLVCSSVLACISVVDLLWSRPAARVVIERDPHIVAVPDSDLGYRPRENLSARIRCWKEDSLVYEVRYDFDRFSRRIVPQLTVGSDEESTGHKAVEEPRHALFMGGSGVFGENIDNEETLPAHFARVADGYHVYNYAFSGYGPQQMYELLRSSRVVEAVAESSGILLYGFIPDHIRRANGTYITLNWGSGFPRYVIDGDKLIRRGSFADSQRCKISFFNLLRSSASLNRLAGTIDNLISLRRSEWKTFLALVAASRDVYGEAFDGDFYVFHWPLTEGLFDDFGDSLQARGVTVLDLAAFGAAPPAQDETVPFDPHPNGRYNAKIAQALSRALRECRAEARFSGMRSSDAFSEADH